MFKNEEHTLFIVIWGIPKTEKMSFLNVPQY